MAFDVSELAWSMTSLRGLHHDDAVTVDEMNGATGTNLDELSGAIEEVLQPSLRGREQDRDFAHENSAVV